MIHRFTIGELPAWVVRDTPFSLPVDAMGTNEDPAVVRSFFEEREPGLRGDEVAMLVHILFVEIGDRRVLFDVGTGDDGADGSTLTESLADAGLPPEQVTDVVVSHFHRDHVGGLLRNGQPTFPNATVHFPRMEMEYLLDVSAEAGPGEALRSIEPARTAGRFELFDDGDEVVPGVQAVGAPGHTPGHTNFIVESAGHRLLCISDTTVNVHGGTRHPEWHMSLDHDPVAAAATRDQVLTMAANEDIEVFAYHFPFPGLGRIRREGGAFAWYPSGGS